jgi:outer membrane autotransporter protein
MFGYAHDFYDSERVLTFESANSRTGAFHAANELSAYTETNYTIGLGDYRVQPLVGLRYIGVGEGAYTETGGIGSLAVDARQTRSLASDVGVRFSRPLPAALNGGIELRTLWTHDYIAQDAQMTARLAGDSSGNSFNADGAVADRNAVLVGASVNTRVRGNLSAHLDYNASLRADTGVQQFLSAAVSYAW